MNLELRFKELSHFLQNWSNFIDLEPIRKYPNHIVPQIEDWIREVKEASEYELIELENSFLFQTENKNFQEFLSKIKSLIHFNSPIKKPSTLEFTTKMKEKKRHEIEIIASLLDGIDKVNFIDIGGGAGYLTENLVNNRERFSFSIDMNKKLQESGAKRINQNSEQNFKKVEFLLNNFGEDPYPLITGRFQDNYVIGLHSCGDLSPHLLQYTVSNKIKSVLSLGCCYHKLTDQYNLSSLAQVSGLSLTKNSFNLATRGYSYQTLAGLKRKIKIRKYRYGLHLYLFSLGHHNFIPTGRTNLADYDKIFSEYASIYAGELIKSSTDAEAFYKKDESQIEIKDIIAIDLIRGLFGRVIEAYLTVDRALYLKENGYQVQIAELFDRKLSPRSLAIQAHLP